MLFKPNAAPEDGSVFVQVHVPRTGGTSLRRLFERAFGPEAFIFNYHGEIETATPEQIERCRLVSGHIAYGLHSAFSKPAHYITVTRDPIARYQSLYAEFLTNASSRLHAAAKRYDIDDFLRFCIYSDDGYTLHQLGNLQCRLISGAKDFQTAKTFIDTKYLLACPLPEIDVMVDMLAAFAGAGDPGSIGRVHKTAPRMDDLASRLVLSDASIDLLFAHDSEDFTLHSYVQQAFAKTRENWNRHQALNQPAPRRSSRSPEAEERPVPPQDLRFMGESDTDFPIMAGALADKVGRLLPPGIGDDFELLDVGCGYGRLAYGLRAQDYPGRYTGFDILPRQIGWLTQNFGGGDRYRFHHVDLYNERYNPAGMPLRDMRLPPAEQSCDCMVALSVFTHMSEREIVEYLRRLKDVLKDGGLFIVTVFRIPPDFTLGKIYPRGTFELTKQVSENGFIVSEEQPLRVIGYREAFLLKLFAREGFEVVSQEKGKWLSGENALDLQDLFTLRKLPSPTAASARVVPVRTDAEATACVICGSTAFGPGPAGRLAPNGRPPRCLHCDSLERHRIARTVLQGLPIGVLNWRRALQTTANRWIEPGWFRALDSLGLEAADELVARLGALADGHYDFIMLDHVLESVRDDRAAFAALRRVLSKRGMLLIAFGDSAGRDKTVDFVEPTGPYLRWHAYGADLSAHFALEEHGMRMLALTTDDPATGTRETMHLFFRDDADFLQTRRLLAG